MSAVQKYNIFNATPRLLIETVCMAGLILYLIFMILSGEDVTSMVSQLGAFGVAAMRLLPSANRINNYLTQISYFEPFLWACPTICRRKSTTKRGLRRSCLSEKQAGG